MCRFNSLKSCKETFSVPSQNSHLLFYTQSPDFHKLGLCYYLKIFVSLGIRIYTMAKIHFRPYNPN